ncbi:hypothetical protein F4860DRAFT_526744 [Xylaria cubensis]|nr:hypothetical protein F4860DRAFT_526744 [Xylaria cubensis]
MSTDWKSEDILNNSKHLEDFFHRDRIRFEDERPLGLLPDGKRRVKDMLKDLRKVPPKFIVWIEGPQIDADDIANPLSSFANGIIRAAEEAQIPTISYCCEVRRDEPLRTGNESREAQATINLICALIRQMIELLPPAFRAGVDLSEGRLRGLDGCILSWSESVRVFRDLIPLMPKKVYYIIDGLHWLDDRSTDRCLEELIQVMRDAKLIALFSTTGRSACLRQHSGTIAHTYLLATDFRDSYWPELRAQQDLIKVDSEPQKCAHCRLSRLLIAALKLKS